MKPQAKWVIIITFICGLFLFAACDLIPTPSPACVPIYEVTKTADTDDGVCSPGDCSLREAVDNANACPGAQTINLPAGGYSLTIDGDDEPLNKTGDLDVTDDLVIIGTGAPSINGNIERAFYIHSGVTATFEGIWLSDGDAIYGGGLVNEGTLTLNNFTCNYNHVSIPPGGMGDAMGGCIFNTSDLTINSGHFLANTAGYGGAVYNLDGATLDIEGSSFTGNEADTHGGAIWNGVGSDLILNDSTLDLNVAGLNGGGIWSHGNLEGESLVFEDNAAAGSGGGIFSWESSAIFNNVWVTQNTASLGGGIYNDHSMVHFYESGLTANHAFGNGGAVNNFDSNPVYPTGGLLMSNVTISGNTAGAGAGIYNSGNFDLRFVTIADNNPEGIRIDAGNEIKLRSSILSNNTGGDCAGITPDSLGYNLTSDSTCPLIGSHDILNVTAMIEPLGFYGGIAPSHPLTYGSPALDSGVPDLCIPNDQNNTSRPQGAWCDRGAFENLYDKGILRGWTYIDANRNNFRDPTDGAVSGMIMELKEGPCPGGAIAATTLSNPDGYYRIYDIEPGDYCIDTSPTQQTMDPEYIDVSFGPGDVLDDVNFRYLLSPLGDSSISGLVWHDECAVPYGTPPTPPPGCINLSGGGLGADGIYDPAEPGIEGIKITFWSGSCFYGGLFAAGEAYTDSNGEFTLPNLTPGTYCLNIWPGGSPNDTILIPGNWTYPDRDVPSAMVDVTLGESEHVVDVNFGWDYLLLPEPLTPFSYNCPAISDAFIRLGPSTKYPELFTILEGEMFEILAKSEPDGPVWYYGHNEAQEEGWISDAVLACEGPEPENLWTRAAPVLPEPEPEPDSGADPGGADPGDPELTGCSQYTSESSCIAAKCNWYKVNDTMSLCIPY